MLVVMNKLILNQLRRNLEETRKLRPVNQKLTLQTLILKSDLLNHPANLPNHLECTKHL